MKKHFTFNASITGTFRGYVRAESLKEAKQLLARGFFEDGDADWEIDEIDLSSVKEDLP